MSTGMTSSAPLTTLYPSWNGPPETVHDPMPTTNFGSGIWSYTRFMRGANFETMVPGTMMTSACRGDARGTPAPKRSRSCLIAYVWIISMLQQAIPNCSMNIEEPRTQFMNLSNFVRMNGDEPNASRSGELNRLSASWPIRASCVESESFVVSLLLIGLSSDHSRPAGSGPI